MCTVIVVKYINKYDLYGQNRAYVKPFCRNGGFNVGFLQCSNNRNQGELYSRVKYQNVYQCEYSL